MQATRSLRHTPMTGAGRDAARWTLGPAAMALTLFAAAIPASAQPWLDPVSHNVTSTLSHGQRAIPDDFDGDGDQDLILSYSLADAVYLALNTAGDASAWDLVEVGGSVVAMYAIPFDADCDGDDDIAAVELFTRELGFESPGRLLWYERPSDIGTSSWPSAVIDDTLVHLYRIEAGDIDDDGDVDLAAVTVSSQFDNVVVWYENRCGELGERWTRWTVAAGPAFGEAGAVRLADVDGDEALDIVAGDLRDDRVVWFANEDNPRRDSWPGNLIVAASGGPSSLRVHDMDADGDQDVLATLQFANAVVWYENPRLSAVGTSSNAARGGWASHPIADIFGPVDAVRGDFDGDGLLDVAAGSAEEAFGGDNRFAIFTNDGDGTYTERMSTFYFSFTGVEAADLDGDDDTDAVTSSYGGDRVDWWENLNGVTPVVLRFFHAEPVAEAIRVAWQASSETDHLGYRLHRSSSPDGGDRPVGPDLFRDLLTYTFEDTEVIAGATYYYTLEAVGVDGTSSRFGPVIARASSLPADAIAVRPNPFSSGAQISLRVPAPGSVRASVHDVSGRLVRTLSEWVEPSSASASTRRLVWDRDDGRGHTVVPGTYFVRVVGEGWTLTRKVVALH